MEFKFVVKVKAEEKEFEIPVNLSKMLELLQSCLSKELTKEIEKVVEEKEEDDDKYFKSNISNIDYIKKKGGKYYYKDENEDEENEIFCFTYES